MREVNPSSTMPAHVFMDKAVVQKINELIHRDPYKECGGFFIGNVSKDEVTGRYNVHIHDLYHEELSGTASSFEFSTDYTMNAVKYVKRNCKGYHIVGNIHSHAQFQAFFSGVDKEMMAQSRDNSFYMVVSPKHGTWVGIFKDIDFEFHECELKIAVKPNPNVLFNKTIKRVDKEVALNGKRCHSSSFRTSRFYSETQQREFDKRFLHSITELKGKKVLIVGAGTIGNLLAEYAMNSGISDLCIVDMDAYQYWNLPRSSMVGEDSLGKPKALELAKAVAEKSSFSIEVTGINADICDLGWGFLKQFDIVLSPVDSAAIRQYIDRGCRIYHIPHITCGTGIVDGDFTGNILAFPSDSPVDLEYVWGNGYREKLKERRSCSDIAEETQAQVMGFSSQIAGMTMDVALKYLLGKFKEKTVAMKYILNAVGNGIIRDKAALRPFKYGKLPVGTKSELFSMLDSDREIPSVTFDRRKPKHELWEMLNEMFQEEIPSYRLNLEWSLNIPVAYRSIGACAVLEVAVNSGVDPTLMDLPPRHIYLVEGEENDYLLEIIFTEET